MYFRPSKKHVRNPAYILTGLIVFCTLLGGLFWHLKKPEPVPPPLPIMVTPPEPQYEDFKEAPQMVMEDAVAEETLVEETYKNSDLVTLFKSRDFPKIVLLLERPDKTLKVPVTILKKHKEALTIKTLNDLKKAEKILKKTSLIILQIPPKSLKLLTPWIKKMRAKAIFIRLEDLKLKGQKIDPKKIEKIPDRLV